MCLNSTFVPIALIVSLEFVKVIQAMFISVDVELMGVCDDGSLQPCQVNTVSLNEELGQVKYVFTDKTGTLTQNCMKFKMCKIGSLTYGDQSDLIERQSMAGGMLMDAENQTAENKDLQVQPSASIKDLQIQIRPDTQKSNSLFDESVDISNNVSDFNQKKKF